MNILDAGAAGLQMNCPAAVRGNNSNQIRLVAPKPFSGESDQTRSAQMLQLVVSLLIIAIIAAVLGFGGIAGAAVGIAKIVFFIALVLFVISLLATGFRGGFGRRL